MKKMTKIERELARLRLEYLKEGEGEQDLDDYLMYVQAEENPISLQVLTDPVPF